jgi:lipopolysaccharide/colanic/teichoic acid biosynthesis glycosyltransferase
VPWRIVDRAAKQVLDRLVALLFLLVLLPLIVVVAIAIRVESPGPAFFRCRRVGYRGREFGMLKFRKMTDGAQGPKLTSPDDERFTRFGRWLASSKLDEVPQLWNVLRGEMSFVGPRPEDPRFVEIEAEAYSEILTVKPGITGLSQLAFARESDILDPSDRFNHYVGRLLPQKTRLDRVYAADRSITMDARILFWTAVAVLGREVAVHRETGRLNLRRRPSEAPERAVEEVA